MSDSTDIGNRQTLPRRQWGISCQSTGWAMALSLSDHKAMMAGFSKLGFVCREAPTGPTNPIRLEWHADGKVHRYRLWAFEITHGGGGPTVRAADEFRIQITNGPA